jgi:hypothetical protein
MRIDQAKTVRTREDLAGALTQPTGPAVVVAKVLESPPTAKPPNDCVQLKARFMAAIAGL